MGRIPGGRRREPSSSKATSVRRRGSSGCRRGSCLGLAFALNFGTGLSLAICLSIAIPSGSEIDSVETKLIALSPSLSMRLCPTFLAVARSRCASLFSAFFFTSVGVSPGFADAHARLLAAACRSFVRRFRFQFGPFAAIHGDTKFHTAEPKLLQHVSDNLDYAKTLIYVVPTDTKQAPTSSLGPREFDLNHESQGTRPQIHKTRERRST